MEHSRRHRTTGQLKTNYILTRRRLLMIENISHCISVWSFCVILFGLCHLYKLVSFSAVSIFGSGAKYRYNC